MTLGVTYWAGGEDLDFVGTGTGITYGVGSGGQSYRNGFARQAIGISGGSTTDPPTPRITGAQFTPNASMWLHAQFGWTDLGGSTTLNATGIRFLDSSGVARLLIRGAGNGAVKISTRNAAGTITDLATSANSAVPTGGAANFPVDVFVSYGSSGTVSVYMNSGLVVTYSGNVTTDSATQLAQVDFSSWSTTSALYWSEMFVSSVQTINGGLRTLAPAAAGVNQAWTGVVSSIDELVILDSAFISDGSAGDLSGWTMSYTIPTGAWLVQSIVQSARCAVGLAGPQHFDWYTRTADGTDHLAGASNAPGLGFGNFQNQIWANNPFTSANWQITDIVVGFNLGLKSLA